MTTRPKPKLNLRTLILIFVLLSAFVDEPPERQDTVSPLT